MPTEKLPTVVQALSAVMQDVRELKKSDRNEFQKFLFRGIDSVMNAVGPALRSHGVVIVPEEILDHEILGATTSQGKYTASARVKVQYRAYGPAGDSIPMQMIGEAQDTADKSSAKAMSVAYRTLLLQAFTLPTDSPEPEAEDAEKAAPAQAPIPQIVVKGRDSLNARIAAMTDEERNLLIQAWQEARLPKLAQATTTKHLEVIKELIDRVHADFVAATGGEGDPSMDQPMVMEP